MSKIESVHKKVEKVEKLVLEIKEELKEIESSLFKSENRRIKPVEEIPSPAKLKEEFDLLFNDYLDFKIESLENFVKIRKLKYLKYFCKINDLPVKSSKKDISSEILICFKQKKVIENDIHKKFNYR